MLRDRMTSRERMLTALGHEKPDRTPMVMRVRPEIMDGLCQRLGLDSPDDVYDALGIDWTRSLTAIVPISFPEFEARKLTTFRGDLAGIDDRMLLHDDGTREDGWGICWTTDDTGKHKIPVRFPLTTPAVGDYKLPTVDDLHEATEARDLVTRYGKDRFIVGAIENPFKRAWYLRGFEDFLADLYENKGFAGELLDRLFELVKEQACRMADAGVDALYFVGDIAMNEGMLISPATWREFFKPRMVEMVSAVGKINGDVRWGMHSDGDMTAVMDDHIEIGFTIINPIQPECMDCAEVKRRYGQQITLHGCGTCQGLGQMSVSQVREHVTEIIRSCGCDGGLVIGSSNVIQCDVPIDNVLAFYETARSLAP